MDTRFKQSDTSPYDGSISTTETGKETRLDTASEATSETGPLTSDAQSFISQGLGSDSQTALQDPGDQGLSPDGSESNPDTTQPADHPPYKPGYDGEQLPMTEGEPIEEHPTREAPLLPEDDDDDEDNEDQEGPRPWEGREGRMAR